MATRTVRKIPAQHVTEYEQVCEHYRQGYRTLFDAAKLYMLLQAGLATALGVILSHPELETPLKLVVNFPLLIIAFIGFASSILALVTAHRYLRYYVIGIERAIELETLYGMKLMTRIHQKIWNSRSVFNSVNSARFLFALIGVPWLFFLVRSFIS